MKPGPPAELISSIIKRIYRDRLTTTSGGNISARDEEGNIWITPAAVDKGNLQPSDIICIQTNGKIIGPHKPSSEFPFHKAIYNARPDINAIVHAHPPALVSFSITRQIPDTRVIANARRICGNINYAGYALPGSEALGLKIEEQFRNGSDAVIMENHGAVVGGTDLIDAYHRFETLEFCAMTILFGKILGEIRYLTDEQITSLDNQLQGQMPELDMKVQLQDEKEKRSSVCEIINRACRQGLMISTFGTVSVRLEENDFLITPSGITKWNISTEDVVQIQDGKREAGKIPSRSAGLHQQIYRDNPGINSIIQTQAPCLMAFGITNSTMNVRTIPESWIFLQDLPTLSFDALLPSSGNIPQLFQAGNPGLIIGNDSVIFTGDTLLQTFDRLEVAEFSAKSILLCTPLGKMIPISDDQVEALRSHTLLNNKL
jgi:L-fuculose-phosphate aldolase